MVPMRTRLVVAGSSKQFAEFVSSRPEKERPHFFEVKSLYNLIGWENVELYYVGSWAKRRDAKKIETEVLVRFKADKIVRIIYQVNTKRGGDDEQERIYR